MNTKSLMVLLGLLLLSAAPAFAGQPLSIRLIEASNKGTEISRGIEDVVPVLQKNFVFKSYKLLGAGVMSLPAEGKSTTLHKYTVTCTGDQSNLTISVHKKKKELMRTNVSLQNGKPLIVGGFPGGSGKRILVFLVR